jgi:hypothetical protein
MRKLLWVDCIAGAVVGAMVLSLSGFLSRLYGLPRALLLFTGFANGVYASYSFALARRPIRPRSLIIALALANSLWAVVCACLALLVATSATAFGLAHLLGEAIFVGGLATLEWRWRDHLVSAAYAPGTT